MKELSIRLAHTPAGQLEQLIRRSPSPDLDDLVGFQWAGLNLPVTASLLGIRKFIKVFERGPDGVEGYNLRAVGTRLDRPWLARGRDVEGSKVGLYAVRAAGMHQGPYRQATLIDYGARPAQFWVARSIVDYLVQPVASDPDVLLGKAYLTFGRVHLPAGYFILERLQRLAAP